MAAPRTQERNQEIRRRYAKGERAAALSDEFGLHPNYISLIGREARKEAKARRNAEIREKYADGEMPASLGCVFGLDPSTIRQICWGMKRKRSPKRKENPVKAQRNQEIRRRYAKGERAAALSDEFGLHPNYIRLIGKEARKEARAKRNAEIRERYADGETQASLAKVFGIHPSSVCRICKGVKRKRIPKVPKKKNPVKAQRNQEIRRRYADGETQAALAKVFGIDISRVCQICRGVERKAVPKRKVNQAIQERNERIREAYTEGRKQQDIADEFGVSANTVWNVCRDVESPKKERNRKIRKAFAEGKTQKEIAEEHDISKGTVAWICKGVVRRSDPRKTI